VRAAAKRGLARARIVRARFARIGVGARADEEIGLHRARDPLRVADRLVERQIGGSGRILVGVDEEDAPLERLARPAIERNLCLDLVEREQELAARCLQRRPVVGEHRVAQRGIVALDLVGHDQLARCEHRADFGIERVIGGRGEGLALDELAIVLGIEHQQDRHMARMRVRPVADDRQALHQRRAVRAIVEPGHMLDLEPGAPHRRVLRSLGIEAPLGIVPDVEFELTRARVELLDQRAVRIVERVGAPGVGLAQPGHPLRWHRLLVAVVRADHHQVVDANRLLGRCRRGEQKG
jgi:hypothetical protein